MSSACASPDQELHHESQQEPCLTSLRTTTSSVLSSFEITTHCVTTMANGLLTVSGDSIPWQRCPERCKPVQLYCTFIMRRNFSRFATKYSRNFLFSHMAACPYEAYLPNTKRVLQQTLAG